jgi:hypothetical protein
VSNQQYTDTRMSAEMGLALLCSASGSKDKTQDTPEPITAELPILPEFLDRKQKRNVGWSRRPRP